MGRGDRIDGLLRPVFLWRGDGYRLDHLAIYADGAIDAAGPTDLDGLRRRLDSGQVATSLRQGAWASIHNFAAWRLDEPAMAITAEDLLGQVTA
ncbi:DUF7638 domain-containing protein [Herbidospora sp. RD11066]